jgi:hypothetical protein
MLPLRWLVAATALLSTTVVVLAQTNRDPWSGCVDPENPDAADIVKIGDRHTICLTLGPGGNWAAGVKYGRYTWRPVADQYSRFHIPDCKLAMNTIIVLVEYEIESYYLILTFCLFF